MKEIFNIAVAIILSLGGSGAVLIGLSSWLGKIWADRILQSEKQKYSLEIEEYKNKLDKQLNLLNSSIDKSIFVTKLQYDKEFSIYLEIWGSLSECVISTKALYPKYENVFTDEEKQEEYKEKKWKRFVENYNEYSNVILKYAPFYEEKLYEGFIKLRNLCMGQANLFKTYEFDVKYNATYAMARDTKMSGETFDEVYIEFPRAIEELQKSLQKEIREYLKSLQAIDQ